MKTCSKCKQLLPFDSFHKNAIRPDGLQTFCIGCNKIPYEKAAAYQRKYIAEIKDKPKVKTIDKVQEIRQYIFDFLSNHPCVDCGESDLLVLEFDHIDPSKKSFTIGGGATNRYNTKFDFDTIKKEIDKCRILCANCHKRKTSKDKGYWKLKFLEALAKV